MSSCQSNSKPTASGCNYESVSGHCHLIMNGGGCESGNYVVGNIDGNGKVTIEPHSNNITSVTIGSVSANGKVTINGNDDYISKIKFMSISNNGKLIINGNHVKEIEGTNVSNNGYVCVTDSDYNNDIVITANFGNNGKFEKCHGGKFDSGILYIGFFLFITGVIGCVARYVAKKKQQQSNGKSPLPTTGTTVPSSSGPITMAKPNVYAEPEIHVSALSPSKYQEPEIKF